MRLLRKNGDCMALLQSASKTMESGGKEVAGRRGKDVSVIPLARDARWRRGAVAYHSWAEGALSANEGGN